MIKGTYWKAGIWNGHPVYVRKGACEDVTLLLFWWEGGWRLCSSAQLVFSSGWRTQSLAEAYLASTTSEYNLHLANWQILWGSSVSLRVSSRVVDLQQLLDAYDDALMCVSVVC